MNVEARAFVVNDIHSRLNETAVAEIVTFELPPS
jgi:hypothetical protein